MRTSTVTIGDGSLMVDGVVGYRSWVPVPQGRTVALRSLYTYYRWPTSGCAEARCQCTSRRNPLLAEIYQTPRGQHTCGLYAYSRRGQNELYSWLGHQILGEVVLWGDVHVHEKGYRGQFARITALYTRSTLSEADRLLTEVAAQTYNVPLVLVDAD